MKARSDNSYFSATSLVLDTVFLKLGKSAAENGKRNSVLSLTRNVDPLVPMVSKDSDVSLTSSGGDDSIFCFAKDLYPGRMDSDDSIMAWELAPPYPNELMLARRTV